MAMGVVQQNLFRLLSTSQLSNFAADLKVSASGSKSEIAERIANKLPEEDVAAPCKKRRGGEYCIEVRKLYESSGLPNLESVRASLRELCGILLVNTLGDVHIISNTLPMPMTMVYAGGHQWMK